MTPEAITLVARRVLDSLHEHFESQMVPDPDYVATVRVIVETATTLLVEHAVASKEVARLRQQLVQHAKRAWLASCAAAADPGTDIATERAGWSKDFDHYYRRKRRMA